MMTKSIEVLAKSEKYYCVNLYLEINTNDLNVIAVAVNELTNAVDLIGNRIGVKEDDE